MTFDCSSDRLLAWRQGALPEHEQQAVLAHVRSCSACRQELAVLSAIEREPAWSSGDALMVRKVAQQVEAVQGASRVITGRRQLRAVPITVGFLFVALGAAALVRNASHRQEPPSTTSGPSSSVLPGAAASAPRKPEPPAPAASSAAQFSSGPPTQHEGKPRDVVERELTADELFRAGNAARQAGANARAIDLYTRLQQQYPASGAALVSRVSLGSVLLGTSAGKARAQFDAYLSSAPRGPLAEEALYGKAEAHRRLGEKHHEIAAYRRLLATYPGSVYARHASQRLRELGSN